VAVSEGGPLRVNYLLEDTTLFGGVKIQLHHANLLHRRGHEVRVVSRGSRPDWYGVEAPFLTVPEFNADNVPEADLNIATYWTTIGPAASLPGGRAVHYCQGFEASYTHNRDEHEQILAAYSLPLPAFALSPHLADLVRSRFGRPARLVPPALEPLWRRRWRLGPARPPRVLVLHPFEIDWKGVSTALEALTILREEDLDLRVVRISQWPLADAERELLEPDEFHCHLSPAEVARTVAASDLLLAPSWDQEGFGMPVLEAMACGVPIVASRIAAFEGFASSAAELVPPHDARGFAEAARRVLTDRTRWRRMRRAGLRAARRFAERRVVREVEAALRWAMATDVEPPP
jgi:glycosyltransferase involved in cell wall biosynthesis